MLEDCSDSYEQQKGNYRFNCQKVYKLFIDAQRCLPLLEVVIS